MLAGRAPGPHTGRLGAGEHSRAGVAISATTQSRPALAVEDNTVARQKMALSIAQNAIAERIRIAKKVVSRNIAISRSNSRGTAFVGSLNRHIDARWDGRP